jgi:hypothetical protein
MNQIARRIIYDRYRRNYCLNNYTPPQWFECDVFELTRSGFFREYEIKQSRSDFFKDADKSKTRWGFVEDASGFKKWTQLEDKAKHQELEFRSIVGPSRFYFVTPQGLIETSELPEFAGLIEWTTNDGNFPWNITLTTKVEAPQLHRCKFTEDRRRKLLEACYWRYHSLSVRLKYPADESIPVAV